MIAAVDIARNIQGALRLAARDPAGVQAFDTSLRGFWGSFFAAALAAPFYVAVILTRSDDPPVVVTPFAFALTETIAYVCAWFAFPLAMVYVTRLIGREAQYVPYIVAANWCSTIPIAIFGVLAMLGASGAIGPGVADFLALVALLWALSFQWFVARTVLEIGGLGAAGIIVLDLIIGIMITGAAQAITTQA